MLSLVIYDQGKESIKDHFTHTMLFGESPRSHEKQNFTLAPFKQRGCGVVYCRLSTTATLSTTPTLSTTTTPAQHLPHPEGPELSTTPHPLAPLPMMIDVGAREIRCGHAAPPTSRVWSRALPCACRKGVGRGLHTRHARGSARDGSIPRDLLARIAKALRLRTGTPTQAVDGRRHK